MPASPPPSQLLSTRRTTRSMTASLPQQPSVLSTSSNPRSKRSIPTPSTRPAKRRRPNPTRTSPPHSSTTANPATSVPPTSAPLPPSPLLPLRPRSPTTFGLIQERLPSILSSLPHFPPSQTFNPPNPSKPPHPSPNTPTIPSSPFSPPSFTQKLYALLLQSILWNQTRGLQALPILLTLLKKYPDPISLAAADLAELTEILRPIGLHNQRARRLVKFAETWVAQPPVRGWGVERRGYPLGVNGGGKGEKGRKVGSAGRRGNKRMGKEEGGMGEDEKKGKEVEEEEEEDAWEIAHLPGVGPYALDSFRIFLRDEMRGLSDGSLGGGTVVESGLKTEDMDEIKKMELEVRPAKMRGVGGENDRERDFEPEWKRVLPTDKELRAYLKWRWAREGWEWDEKSGKRKRTEWKGKVKICR